MSGYVYLAIVLAISGFMMWLYRAGYSLGYKKGKEEIDALWQRKGEAITNRISDRDDTGFGVLEHEVSWGKGPSVEVRMEPSVPDEDKRN